MKRKTRLAGPPSRIGNFRLLVTARRMRCCGLDSGRRLRSHSSLTRRGRGRFGLAGAGNQHQAEQRKRGNENDRFFHSVNCLFNNDSSQLALKDVLERRNSLKLLSWRVAALTHPASVLLPEFWP
jgi:hypothetical protein